ncbi:MAG: hypothetical protein LBU11_12100 [Zoogloeaceae bacterium]|jgi:hypothetical protein|nr:hypothetical protein [Zoogloeaceae bacterium]
MRRVVITGIGPLCAGKRGAADFFRALLEKETLLEPIPPEYERHYRAVSFHPRLADSNSTPVLWHRFRLTLCP